MSRHSYRVTLGIVFTFIGVGILTGLVWDAQDDAQRMRALAAQWARETAAAQAAAKAAAREDDGE